MNNFTMNDVEIYMQFMNEIHNNQTISDCNNIAMAASAAYNGKKAVSALDKYLKQFKKKKKAEDMNFKEMSG